MNLLAGTFLRNVAALMLLAGAAVACDSNDPKEPEDKGSGDGIGTIPYALDEPDASFALPPELLEISGITVLPAGRIGAVQDEEGIVFVLDPASGTVLETRPFGEAGDYEDITLVNDAVWVLRADGTLFELNDWASGTLTVTEIESGLRPRHDPEGLAFDAARNRLLIACKGNPGNDLDEDSVRTVYAFDLTQQKLIEEPILVMDRDTVDAVVRGGGKFEPSAIALHPVTQEIYVLSSGLRSLVVYGLDGSIRAARSLSRDLFEQPEGLLFLPDGTMMISSEGVDGPGIIHRFNP